MILVTVGTQRFPFNRLLKKVDDLIDKKVVADEVIGQTGHSDYRPRYYSGSDFFEEEEFYALIDRCEILITHGGIGTITKGLLLKKKVIIVPRRKEYGEHIDNHQMEIGERFSEMGYTVFCRDPDRLEDALKEIDRIDSKPFHLSWVRSAGFVRDYLSAAEAGHL